MVNTQLSVGVCSQDIDERDREMWITVLKPGTPTDSALDIRHGSTDWDDSGCWPLFQT
jgi:hypothetical protein